MMVTACFCPPGHAANRRVLLTAALLASAAAIAQENSRLHVPPGSEELLSDEIYEQAGAWREPSISDSEWRVPPTPPQRSRINFGYDSVHEELRARDDVRYDSTGLNPRDTQKSNTQLRLQF